MKPFETALKNFAFFGIGWDASSKRYIYRKNYFVLHLALCVLGIIAMILFLVYDAKTFFDFTFAFFEITIAVMCLVICFSVHFKIEVFHNHVIERK